MENKNTGNNLEQSAYTSEPQTVPEDNFVEKRDSNSISELQKNLPLPEEPKAVPLPSNQEMQEETEESLQQQERLKKLESEITRNTGKKPTKVELQYAMLKTLEQEEEKARQAQETEDADTQLENQAENARIQKALEMYEETKSKYAERGLPFEVDENFETLIAQREQEAQAAAEQAEDKRRAELEHQKALEEQKRRDEIEAEKKLIKIQENKEQAEKEVAAESIVKQQEDQLQLQSNLEREDEAVNFTNFDGYWDSRTTGQKILTGIGMFLGALGGAGNEEAAFGIINKAIERNIEEKIRRQEINRENYWKEREHSLKVAKHKLDTINSKVQNKLTQAQTLKLSAEIDNEINKAYNSRLINAKLSANKPLTKEEVFNLSSANESVEPNRFIAVGEMPNPTTGFAEPVFAYAPTGGEEELKKAKEAVIVGNKAAEDLNRLLEISEQPLGGAFDVFTARPQAQAIVQSLIGNLRLELFGPGVLTDMEQKIARDIVRDPTKIFSLKKANQSSINYMIQKMRYGVRERLRSVGVSIPPSKNEANIQKLIKKGGLTRAKAINSLIRNNKWQQESTTGY
jgi:chemotaxis protein histidine kinase CheA